MYHKRGETTRAEVGFVGLTLPEHAPQESVIGKGRLLRGKSYLRKDVKEGQNVPVSLMSTPGSALFIMPWQYHSRRKALTLANEHQVLRLFHCDQRYNYKNAAQEENFLIPFFTPSACHRYHLLSYCGSVSRRIYKNYRTLTRASLFN